jgi:DHA2 family multidrug resistance protein
MPNVVRAIGQALVLTPLSALAMAGITAEEAGNASGLFNMLRNLGGAIGTAVLETFFTKREQYHSFMINARVSDFQEATRERLSEMQRFFMAHGIADPATAMHQAVIAVGGIIRGQATLMGYADCFGLLGAVLAIAALTVAMLKKGAAGTGGAH